MRPGPEGVWGIVLAAGSGSRFGGSKQFLTVGGHRLVDLSLRATASVCAGVVVVLPEEELWDGEPVAAVTAGGDTRIESSRRGLEKVPSAARIILIHDAAHPLASRTLFLALLDAMKEASVDAAVPVLPAVDTVMRIRDGRVVETIPRKGLVSVQTPQAFKAEVLRSVHELGQEAPDESVLMERSGAKIKTIPGEIGNLHVTTKDDLTTVSHLLVGLQQRSRSTS